MRRGILLAGTVAALSFAALSAASAQVVVSEPAYAAPVYYGYAGPAYSAYGYDPGYVVAPRYRYRVPAYGYTSGVMDRGACQWNNGERYCY
ncbi:MAG TPA: hypothetical protein VFB45_26140 [Pseudolabrys sp.]|nr:hypothetical protein [Pseudolabrys sp.]